VTVALAVKAVRTALPLRAQAFGIDLEFGFDAPGFSNGRGSTHGRSLSAEVTTEAGLASAWVDGGAVRIHERRWGDGTLAWTIDFDSGSGYLVWADNYGRFLLSPDGSRLLCSPLDMEAWRWQLFLVGQLAPFAAVLQGLEVFHASVVAIGDEAVAFVGPSRAGKSALAVNLALRGANFLADDVLVLERDGDTLLAHPGPGLASVRHEVLTDVNDADRGRLGAVLGSDDEAARVAVPRDDRSLPLSALYFLDRLREPRLRFEPLAPPDPRLLLGASFNFFVRTPARLRNQLELCGLIAESVRVVRLGVPADMGPGDLADAVLIVHSAPP
jgi:hypothetical protein